ncbi:MAG: MFS transporter, partial [Pseudomonadota bacterium]
MTIHHVIVFSVSAFLFLMSQFYRFSVAVIAPRLMLDLGIDTEGLSLMSAAFFYGFAFTQVPLAVFLDRIGARKTMATLNLVGVAGAIAFAVSDSLALLTISRLMLGIGMASNLMGTFKLISVWFHPGRFATLTTMVVSLGTGGTLMATTPLALLLEAMGWRASFLLFAGINLLLTMMLIIFVRDQPPKAVHPEPLSEIPGTFRQMISGLKLLFREKDYWIIS